MGFGTLIQRITYKVSGRSSSSSGLYVPSTNQYDYALGGIPFLSATNDTRPDTEKPVQQRKQQFDSFHDPGEQSLNQWWLRSQTSFIGGAGVIYQDPDTSGVLSGTSQNLRYSKSIGIDPFTNPNSISLLHQSAATGTTNGGTNQGFCYVKGILDSGVERVWVVQGNKVYMTQPTGSGLTTTSTSTVTTTDTAQGWTGGISTTQIRSTPGSTPVQYMHSYMADTNTAIGGIYESLTTGGLFGSTQRIYVAASSLTGQVTIAFGRGTILFGQNNLFYQLTAFGPANTPLPVASASLPQDQVISSIVDGPDAVYISANDDTRGYIYKSTFSNTGSINGMTQVAIMPAGETINSMAAYVATYMVISTATGFRIADFTGSGLTYGINLLPVKSSSLTPGPDSGGGFGRITFFGSKAYITTLNGNPQHDGSTGLMAVDLSLLIPGTASSPPFNPRSTWTYVPGVTTAIAGITVTPSGRTIYTTGNGIGTGTSVFIEDSTQLITTGYLDTGRCRFNTVEPKLFKFFSIRTPVPLNGNLSVALLSDDGSLTNYVTYGPAQDPGDNDIATPVPTGPRQWVALRFTLNRGATDATIGAVLESWQIKALPGTLKQRMITRQFLCFNSQKDKGGQVVSGDTLALDQLTAVRQMCQRGDTITFQDLANNISDQVIIDDYQFTMLGAPGPNKENYGGYLTVMLRTVADSVPPLSLAGTVVEE